MLKEEMQILMPTKQSEEEVVKEKKAKKSSKQNQTPKGSQH